MAVDARQTHALNRLSWEAAANGSYQRKLTGRLHALAAGREFLHPVEEKLLSPVLRPGAALLHLQCSQGLELLSLRKRGLSRLAGLDISSTLIEQARWLAGQLASDADWYCADVLDAAAIVEGTFDVVLTGKGAINWVHDLDEWARNVRTLLRPGGSVIIFDLHPAVALFRQDTDALTATGNSYFDTVSRSKGWAGSYVGPLPAEQQVTAVKTERVWTVSSLVSALLAHDLTITHVGEHTEAYWPSFPRLSRLDRETFPKTLSVRAQRR
jgi:2-polyprenyl-3-methyl-5-hydroxy-6-metoxy-1,4-benzoquinol methylase